MSARCRLASEIALGLLVLCLARCARAEPGTEFRHGVVVSDSAPASDVGVAVLRRGGNAVDAAIATAFALAVTHPVAGNIGGGGFMTIFPGPGREPLIVEYREAAPAAAMPTMFAGGQGNWGARVVGVPGTVAGLALAHERLGKLPWKALVMPAVRLAADGFRVDPALARSLDGVLKKKNPAEFTRIFAPPGGRVSWQSGDRLVQPDLARTLQKIAEQGPSVFYRGSIAEQIVDEMKRSGGLITREDLAAYRAHVVAPIHGTYRGFDVFAPPPPSSGGVCLIETLNILENFELRPKGRWSAETLHLMIEAMRRAYCDRARFLGDPAFVRIPTELTSKEYARRLAGGIVPDRATPSEQLAPDVRLAAEGPNTTHFSVIDQSGMAVANTYTLEQGYGSRIVVRGAGFLLNDEMNDFNWRPGVTDRKGAIGTPPNQIAPHKRMLSSQTPTIVARNGKVVLVTGSPGSRTIINTVLNVVVNVVDFGMPIQAAVDAPRVHHQWFPDVVKFEGGAKYTQTIAALRRMGHRIEYAEQGDAHSIWVNPRTGGFVGAADPRGHGKAAGY